jgi:hypothetical protein
MRYVALTAPLCAVLAVCGLLAACSRDNRQADIKMCIATAQHDASQEQPGGQAQSGESDEERHDRIGGLVTTCMEQAGYRHDQISMADERCVDDVDYNPYCYARRS